MTDFKRIARDDIKEYWAMLGVRDGREIGPVKPFQIATRNAKGELEEEPCAIALVTLSQKIKARNKAREFAKELKLDPSFDGEDAVYVRTLERIEILCYAIREYDPKLGDNQDFPVKFANSADLVASVGGVEEKLSPIWSAYDNWIALNDPRYGELSEEQIWEVIKDIATTGVGDPLVGIDGLDQARCLVRMARQALRSPSAPSSLRQPSTSQSE